MNFAFYDFYLFNSSPDFPSFEGLDPLPFGANDSSSSLSKYTLVKRLSVKLEGLLISSNPLQVLKDSII